MTEDLYYCNDTVTIAFTIEETMPPIRVASATVSVAGKKGVVVEEKPVPIVENKISYEVPADKTADDGDYVALFNLTFEYGQKRTHPVMFSVLPRKLPAHIDGLPVSLLTEHSTPEEAEDAVGRSMQILRKKGLDTEQINKDVYNTAQTRLKRRLPK